ncbi:MAG: NAD(P)H-hydrate dehydratase [Candidatus Izemoplasmatales bacterium]|nr:NAD(P)H-hydrate dehydratase [Candidatus Izemoplasmatales bacterium]
MRQRVVTVAEMTAHEQFTCQKRGIDQYELMEQAGQEIFYHFLKEEEMDQNQKIWVIAGIGNNGGDALVFARHAIGFGLNVEIGVVGEVQKASPMMFQALQKIEQANITYFWDLRQAHRIPDGVTHIIDGLFGSGIQRNVINIHKRMIDAINDMGAKVTSIDIPSGINADTGEAMGVAVHADKVLVIGCYKKGNLLLDGLDHAREVDIIDIGLIFDPSQPIREKWEFKDVIPIIPSRMHRSNKYDYGSVLTVGGSPGMMGAPQLSAMAALRSGAGLSSIGFRRDESPYMNLVYPELMVKLFENTSEFKEMIQNKAAVVFGPGLGKHVFRNERIIKILLDSAKKLVIDADGLVYFKPYLDSLPNPAEIVMTPHLGEMSQFFGVTKKKIETDPEHYIDVLRQKGLCVVLKGHTTIIGYKDQTAYIASGNPGMATAGTGDVLAGIIASLIGQGMGIFEATTKGVLLHAKAGELAAQQMGYAGMIASDMIVKIPEAIRLLQ